MQWCRLGIRSVFSQNDTLEINPGTQSQENLPWVGCSVLEACMVATVLHCHLTFVSTHTPFTFYLSFLLTGSLPLSSVVPDFTPEAFPSLFPFSFPSCFLFLYCPNDCQHYRAEKLQIGSSDSEMKEVERLPLCSKPFGEL